MDGVKALESWLHLSSTDRDKIRDMAPYEAYMEGYRAAEAEVARG